MSIPAAASRRYLIGALFVATALLAVALRWRQAGASLVFDEYAALYFSEQPWRALWGWWLVRETNPPLFYSVLKLWRMVAPENELALRVLPVLVSLAQIALVTRFAGRFYGWVAALACLLLFALSPSDIYQSAYIRGYGLAKLAVTVSFIGLVAAMRQRRDCWLAYVVGAVVAIYCHTTMLLWPVIGSLAVLVELGWQRRAVGAVLVRLAACNLAIIALSGWELVIALAQMRTRAGNISWIKPLSPDDFLASVKLQLLMAGPWTSALMLGLMVVGVVRTWRNPATRMALTVAVASVLAFKGADLIHPITTDFTLHWAMTFTALLAVAALAPTKAIGNGVALWLRRVAGAATLFAIAGVGLAERNRDDWIPHPQDWRRVVDTMAGAPGAALLVSHEAIGVVMQEACRVRFHRPACPFPLVVMRNDSLSDSWAFGGYRGPIVPPGKVREALGRGRVVYVFSRYVYTPLEPLGLDPGDYPELEWDDGELIGPVPVEDFDAKGAG